MKCNNCQKYLAVTGDCVNYLVIEANEKNPDSEIGSEIILNISPPIEGDWHFCGFDCLAGWANKNNDS